MRFLDWAIRLRGAPDPIDPPGVTVSAAQVRAAYFVANVAMVCLIYFLWLYTLDLARDRAGELTIPQWFPAVTLYFPYIVGFTIVAFAIPYVAKIAIPTFMALDWRHGFWPKLWSLFIALAVSTVIISGTFAVQGNTIMERDRESAVAVETAQNGRAAIQAQIDGITADLRAATENPNRTMAQAASVGMLAGSAAAAEAEWTQSYVRAAEAARAGNVELLRRATGAARAAGAAVERREALRLQLAAAPAIASVQGEVTTARTSWIAATLGWLEGARAILLSLVMDVICLMMPWIARHLELRRNAQLVMAAASAMEPLPDNRQIPDYRAEPPVEFRAPAQDAQFVDAMRSEAAKRGWQTRRDKVRTEHRIDPLTGQQYEIEVGRQQPSDSRVARSEALDQPIIIETPEEPADEPQEESWRPEEVESAESGDGREELSEEDLDALADDEDIVLADGAGVMKVEPRQELEDA